MPSARRKKELARRKLEQEVSKKTRDGKCGVIRQSGKRCRRPAGWGTKHLGEGACEPHERLAAKQEAESTKGGMARLLEVSPGQAMASVLHLSAGQLAYATMKVNELSDEDLFDEESGAHNVWFRLQRSLMHDLAKFAKISADAGIDERMAQAIEQQTEAFGRALEAVVGSLDLNKKQRAALGPAIRRELTTINGEATDVVTPSRGRENQAA